MQGLNLYAQIEQYFEFEDEVEALHSTFKDIIDELKPDSLLDIGCGQGEFLQKLSYLEIKTLGIDLSSTQIKIAKLKNLDVQCIDLCDIDKTFDCATAVFDVVNYISQNEINSFFKCCSKSLNYSGYFIFDINTLYGFEEVADGTLTIDNDKKFISIDALYSDEVLQTDITVFTKDKDLYKKEMGTIKQFYHSKEFLSSQLKNCNFEIESVLEFKLHDVEQFDKQIFICRKV